MTGGRAMTQQAKANALARRQSLRSGRGPSTSRAPHVQKQDRGAMWKGWPDGNAHAIASPEVRK